MKLLHTADLHLGKILHEQPLLDDQIHILGQLAQILEQGDFDLFLIAGDVFDRSVPPPEAVAAWDDFLRRITLSCPRLETVIVSGNHDGALRLSFASRFLDEHRVHVRTNPAHLDIPVSIQVDGQDWDIFAVPFLQAGSLGETVGTEEPALLRRQKELWKEACRRLEAARRPGVSSILVSHLFTLGGSESDSERMFVGDAEQIPASWLEGWAYTALGHLHRPQQPAPKVRYSGSPLAYSFSEAGQEKSALQWEDGELTLLPLRPLRPLTRLSGAYEDFASGPGWDAYREHWLELSLTDSALVPGPLERLRLRFPGLLSLVQAPVRAAEAPASDSRRRSGDLVGDTLRFLEEVGFSSEADLAPLLTSLAKEVGDAAP